MDKYIFIMVLLFSENVGNLKNYPIFVERNQFRFTTMALNASYFRYIIIDECLNNKYKPFPSMEELIDACERKLDTRFSISSIQKDIQDLKKGIMGEEAPIKYSKSKEGYYYSDAEFTIRKIGLQESEIEALKASADLLSMFTGSRVSENFGRAVDKIFASIHESFPDGKGRHKIVQTDNSSNHKGFEYFEFFLHAAKERIPVCFVHYSYKHRVFKSVIVHPLILKEFQNNWYLVGHSENHKELRTFGLDRIYEPKLLKRLFKEPTDKIKVDYFKNIYGVYPYDGQKLQKIEFRVNPLLSDYMHAHPIHESQKRKKEGSYGHAIFTLQLIPSHELINFFLSFSHQLVVIKPDWIQKEIHERHLKALHYEKIYQR